jgi:ubiquinone/menaquinone biosynthesis C-methylase UbiE
MDALMCDEGSVWDPAPQTRRDAAAMCAAVARVLKPNGCFVQISFAQPNFSQTLPREQLS